MWLATSPFQQHQWTSQVACTFIMVLSGMSTGHGILRSDGSIRHRVIHAASTIENTCWRHKVENCTYESFMIHHGPRYQVGSSFDKAHSAKCWPHFLATGCQLTS